MNNTYIPKVVLVGRTNVGKSTLFNRIAKRTNVIVFDREGVTRDYLHETILWNNKQFNLIDTGGLATRKTGNPFHEHIQQVGLESCEAADVIIFVCDVKNGMTEEDRQLTRMIYRLKKSTILVLNKSDNKNAFAVNEADFYALGFTQHIATSATHGTGITELLNTVTSYLPEAKPVKQPPPAFTITLIGKPNVGKSSLMNALLDRQRSIVSDIPGTTRESISERLSFYGEDLLVTDTAGLRRKRKVTERLETLMVKSSLQSVRKADLVILVVDGNAGRLSDQELKLLFYTFEEQHKALLLVFNKRDLMTPETEHLLSYELGPYEHILKYIPKLKISCKTGKNVGYVLREIQKIRTRLATKIPTMELTELIQERLRKRRLFHNRQQLKVRSIKQVSGRNLTFSLCVNFPRAFGQSQLACIENILRRTYDLRGCPLEFIVEGA